MIIAPEKGTIMIPDYYTLLSWNPLFSNENTSTNIHSSDNGMIGFYSPGLCLSSQTESEAIHRSCCNAATTLLSDGALFFGDFLGNPMGKKHHILLLMVQKSQTTTWDGAKTL